MSYDDEDLFDEEFDFVDDDDSDVEDSRTEDSPTDELDTDVEEEEPAKPKRRAAQSANSKANGKRAAKKPAPAAEEEAELEPEVEEPEVAAEAPVPTGPPADHVVHIYEFGEFKRTIQREFTDEDSIKFAEEFNRTSKNYGRHAVPVERDEEPEPRL